MIQLRLATLEDVAEVAGLDGLAPERLRSKADREELLIALDDQMSVGERVVGSLRFGFMWDDSPFIHQIIVSPQRRGEGIGTLLLDHLHDKLRQLGYERLLSSSVCSEARAQHWHRRSGFGEVGIIAGLNRGGIGEVFFSKDIRAGASA